MYAEIVFETGSKSVTQVDDLDELKAFAQEHHRRAVNGEAGGPTGHNAERIKKVLLYENHPGDDTNSDQLDAQTVSDLISGMAGNKGKVSMSQLVAALRDEASPVYTLDQGRHASQFKADAVKEFSYDELMGGGPNE